MNKYDNLQQAINLIKKYNNPSISLLRLEMKISLEEAENIMNDLIAVGFITKQSNSVLYINHDFKLVPPKNTQQHSSISATNKLISICDNMDGFRFENFCAEVLRYNGYSNVKVTSGSGDFGVDILCTYNSVTYAIQCKCYSHPVGNKAVQEIYSGKTFYNCEKAIVLTNNYFTPAAEETARITKVILWDRGRLNELLQIALQNNFPINNYK